VDNEVGGAGSTGRGEEDIKIAGGHTIVEMMRRGSSPTDACMEAMHRVVRNYKPFPDRLKKFHIQFYALNKNGEYGASSLWGKHNDGRPMQFAVHDGSKARLVRTTPMFDEAGGDY
jgi:N4-(beta-N-acetylglucosaminyl)-L-asparaginase